MSTPKFLVGQLVHHCLFDYRGVIYDVDEVFRGSDEWYEEVARSRPPRDRPWYRILVHEVGHETYVAEQNLEEDDVGEPIEHPMVDRVFGAFKDGYYELAGDYH
jgi:heat shock protein HspQ